MSSQENPEKVVIFGSGPAGLSAAIYASRANLTPIVFEGMEPGGQLTTTTDVDNYPGFAAGIMGPELMEQTKAQAARFGTRFEMDECESVDFSSRPFNYKLSSGSEGWSESIIIATGATARYLGLPNEERLRGYGVSACATCDGFFYGGQVIAVVGGGDSAAEESTFLTKFATKVYLIVRRDVLRASKVMQDRVFNNDKIEILWNTEVVDVHGEKEVSGIRIVNNKTQEERDIELAGFFLAIGHIPNTNAFSHALDTDPDGYLITESDSTKTNVEGVFACGDVQDRIFQQAVTAAGSGCMAALEAEKWLEE